MAVGSFDCIRRLVVGREGVTSKATSEDRRETIPYDRAVRSSSMSTFSWLWSLPLCAIRDLSKFAILSRAQTFAIPTVSAACSRGTLTVQS